MFLALAAWCGSASAFPRARLVYVRGEGAELCPAEMELRMAVAHRLGYDPFDRHAEQTLLVVIERVDDALRGGTQLVGPEGFADGLRRFNAPSDRCDDLMRALALSMSLAIDPEQDGAPRRPEPVPATVTPERAAPPLAPSRAERPAEPLLMPSVGWGAHAALGSAPSLAGGIDGFARLRVGFGSVALGARLDAPASAPVAGGGVVRSSLVAGTLSLCGHWAPALACASGLLGRVTASSQGVESPRSDSGSYAAVGGRLGVELPVTGRLSLYSDVALLRTLTELEIQLDERPVWSASELNGSVGIGLFVSF